MSVFQKTLERIDAACAEAPVDGILTPYRILEGYSDGWSAEERAVLSEEIAEMALPTVLDGGANYIKLAELRSKNTGAVENIPALKEKLNLLSRSMLIDRMSDIPKGFGFVTYPGYLLVEREPLTRRFPGKAESYFEYAYPAVYEIEGVRKGGKPMPGWMAFFFMRPQDMRENKDLLKAKTLEAVRSLEKLNSGITGLGGLSASYTGGGRDIADKTTSALTTGHNYTVANIINTLKEAARLRRLPLGEATVAVVGAAGSVGSGSAALAASLKVKEIILIDPRPLTELAAQLRRGGASEVTVGSIGKDIPRADVILVATSSLEAFLRAQDLKRNAIIIDDSQPKNVGSWVMAERSDVMILEGGAVALPKWPGFKVRRAFGPTLKEFGWGKINNPMSSDLEAPCCLAEAMIWSLLDEDRSEYSVGRSDSILAKYLDDKARGLGFGPGALQAYGKVHDLSQYQGAKAL